MRQSSDGESSPNPKADASWADNDVPSEDRRPRRRRGATVLEYVFVASLILTAVMMAVGSFGESTKNTAQKANDAIQKATNLK